LAWRAWHRITTANEGLRREALTDLKNIKGVEVVDSGRPRLAVHSQVGVGSYDIAEKEERSTKETVEGSREVGGVWAVAIIFVVLAKVMMSMAWMGTATG
jgi:hypothetical protein